MPRTSLGTAVVAATILIAGSASAEPAPGHKDDGATAGAAPGKAACHDGIESVATALKVRQGQSAEGDERWSMKTGNGGRWRFAEDRPAEPVESWFDSNPNPKAQALTALQKAIDARDEAAWDRCLQDVTDAKDVLREAATRKEDTPR